ncbi:MAG TPA: amino acid adenylation domain-containing protein [Pyrinomonadaceae bacterium]|jgi:amino acid adenylation domain-containing protein
MRQQSIQEIFSGVAESHARRVAFERGGRLVTYRELEDESNRLANFLISSGAEKGSIVAIMAADPARVLASIIAVLKAGCVFAPFDPLMPDKRLKAMAGQITPRWFVIEAEHFGRVSEITAGTGGGVRVVCADGAEPGGGTRGPLTVVGGLARYTRTERPAVESEPDDMCSIFFTSGSTGVPKGIAGRLKGIAHFALWEAGALGVTAGTRVSQLTSPCFDGFLKDVFVPLCAGGTTCAPESREVALDARALAEWIGASRINVLHCVPSLFRSLTNVGLGPDDFPDLRHVVLAGEPLLPADVGRWADVFGERIRLLNLYGPTETTVTKLFHFVRASDRERRRVPIGKAMPGAAALVVDERGGVCPPGEVGEILIRTPYRALGYYNRPELTAAAFVPNPFGDDPRDVVYRTGDYGRLLEDGDLEFVGREDQQVKIRGVRIELGEVENLLRAHGGVRDVAVIDREDSVGNKYLCAYVVLAGGVEPDALKEHLALSLPAFMMPSAFVRLDALPRTLNGKLDRKALPAPGTAAAGAGDAYVPPRTASEEVVAGVWADVLGVERVGVHDNFFDLGGHSLLATQVISRVRSALGAEVALRRLFEGPTVVALAAAAESALRDGAAAPPRLERAPRAGDLPLSFAQQRLWFLDQLEPGSAFYNVPAAVRLRGRLDADAFWRALDEVVRRHEALRTHFRDVNGRPAQVVSPPCPLPRVVSDLSALPEQERERAAADSASEWATLPFDLARGPLLRVRLLRLGDEEHVVLFTMHHIVGDLWSMGVLVREMATLYEAFSHGLPSPLAELPVQYADYAVWQRAWLQGEVLAEQLAYWRRQLAGAPALLELPTDRPRAEQTFKGARVDLALPRSLGVELKALGRREGVTLFMTLLAAFGATLHNRARQTDILIGTPVANRQRTEVENLIGFFLNTLVLRINFAGDPSFRELLRRVREVALGAYAHQDVPFEKLVEELRPERSLSHNPLFQVAFTLDQFPAHESKLGDLTLSPVETDKGTTQFDLVLRLADTPAGVAGTLQYMTGLFEEGTVRRLVTHFESVLRLAVARPDVRLGEVAAELAEADRRAWAEMERGAAAVSLQKLRTARR